MKGATDRRIAAYAADDGRFILTSDDDFLREFSEAGRPPLLFLESDSIANAVVADIVVEISACIEQDAIEEPLYVSREWL